MQNQREEALEPPGLACNGLTLGYDGRPVIEGLDLSLPPGASLAIVGESVRFRICAQASSGSISVFFRGSA